MTDANSIRNLTVETVSKTHPLQKLRAKPKHGLSDAAECLARQVAADQDRRRRWGGGQPVWSRLG